MLRLSVPKKVGKRTYNFGVEGKNMRECLLEAQKLSFEDVDICGICKSDNLILNARVAQDYEYTEVKCIACKASLVFGRPKKEPDTFYVRKDDNKKLDWQEFKIESDSEKNKK